LLAIAEVERSAVGRRSEAEAERECSSGESSVDVRAEDGVAGTAVFSVFGFEDLEAERIEFIEAFFLLSMPKLGP
jgi:hypothetical protein